MFAYLFARRAVHALLSINLAAAAATSNPAPVCNGHAQLCSRTYGNVTFVGAHDSYAVGASNVAANQDYNVTQQLNDGIRLLQNQIHSQSDGLHLCHSECPLYDAGLLVNYLVLVRKWLSEHPNEVLTILLVNIDDVNIQLFADVYEAAGLVNVSFAPNAPSYLLDQWPTLSQMITTGQRLVTFVDTEANYTTAPYLINEFTNVWETGYDVTSPDWPCTVNRSKGNPTNMMYMANHFLDTTTTILGFSTLIPDKAQLNVTNAASGPGSLGQEVENCIALHGVPPNFLLVDFYDYGEGSVFDVAAQLNGVPTPTVKPAPPIINATATISSGVGTETSVPLHTSGTSHNLSSISGTTWFSFIIGLCLALW